jgi:small redox-active disulfide protein 2
MEIKILGPGCPNCERLEKYTRAVVQELGIDASITKIKDMNQIISYDILSTPGLVINDEVVSSGRVPSKAEVTTLITTALAEAES